jgi:uncharacterized protein Yka (UPF0111/DUF47 family)
VEVLNLRNVKRVLVVGEKTIFRELSEIVDIAKEANSIMTHMLLDGLKGKPLTDAMQAIKTLEKKSDDVAFKVSEDITSGAVSQNVLDDLLESVQRADTLLDLYYSLSRELGRMSNVKLEGSQIGYESEWAPLFEKMLSLAGNAFPKVENLLATSNPSEMSEIRRDIETIEEQGDDIKDAGFDKLYAESSKLSFVQFIHYSEILHKLDDILDACEDLSDLAVSTVTSILK